MQRSGAIGATLYMTLTLRTRTHATAWHGAALIAQGSYEGGVAEMRRGFAAFRATGGMPFAMFWYYLACGLGRSGRPQENFKWWRTDLRCPGRRCRQPPSRPDNR